MWPFSRDPAPRLVVDRIISLGALCEVAFQARRFARAERAYPFDWWITPMAGVGKALEAGTDAVFAPEHLVKVPDYGGDRALYSRLSGTVHLHEYPKAEDFLLLGEDAIAATLQSKYAFLHRRMLDDCQAGTILFVRQRMAEHDPKGEALETAVEQLLGQLSALGPDVHLLLLDYSEVQPHPRLIQARVPRLNDVNDLGSRKGWDLMFRSAGIACRNQGQRFAYEDLKMSFGPKRWSFNPFRRGGATR